MRTTARVGARGDVAGAGAALLGRYAGSERRYHDIAHLDEVLRHVDELAADATDADVVRLAAWFHDAVYDPRAADNEERSARLAEKVLAELRVDDRTIDEVARLVRLTADHHPDPGDADGAVLCDADLAVLAGSPDRYQAYARAVREEYAQVGDDDFAAGRLVVLRSLLDRPTLFTTAGARADWEAAARDNVTAEIARLANDS